MMAKKAKREEKRTNWGEDAEVGVDFFFVFLFVFSLLLVFCIDVSLFFSLSVFLIIRHFGAASALYEPNDSSYYYIGKKKKMGVAVGSNADSTCV